MDETFLETLAAAMLVLHPAASALHDVAADLAPLVDVPGIAHQLTFTVAMPTHLSSTSRTAATPRESLPK
jgi:hypothetical protein